MKLPRNARIFQGQLEAAPFASVLFLLVLFVLMFSLVSTPGVRVGLELPRTDDLPGVSGPTLAVAMDKGGSLYFHNQQIEREALESRLGEAVKENPGLTLVVLADKEITYENLVGLEQLAQRAGIKQLLLATLPRVYPSAPAATATAP